MDPDDERGKSAESQDSDSYLTAHSRSIKQDLFKDVFVHIDFKGAPPTFEFLLQFLRFIGSKFRHFVTGIMFEFEDCFPYQGYLESVTCFKAYSPDQIKELVACCKSLNLKVSVIIQCFGHLECAVAGKGSNFDDAGGA